MLFIFVSRAYWQRWKHSIRVNRILWWTESLCGPPIICWSPARLSYDNIRKQELLGSGSVFFPVVMYQWDSWTIRKAEHRRIDGFKFWCWRRLFFSFLFSFIFISWRLTTLQNCSGFCHTLTWISHGFTCVPHPDPPSHLPLNLIPLGLPSAPGLSTCLMHPAWAGDLFHPW